ncbi:hypothetical protein KP509_13G071000 [Ceratopteris richardii]|uniref:Uncharacterized protein n=1 Tax=Ceratopteris richardii TaxID=49495 RepID=A0A8T2TJS0_CERRI|nr:hypothetical protein KP509_13G071000 [Ceratopteris richardii]
MFFFTEATLSSWLAVRERRVCAITSLSFKMVASTDSTSNILRCLLDRKVLRAFLMSLFYLPDEEISL